MCICHIYSWVIAIGRGMVIALLKQIRKLNRVRHATASGPKMRLISSSLHELHFRYRSLSSIEREARKEEGRLLPDPDFLSVESPVQTRDFALREKVVGGGEEGGDEGREL